MGIESVGGMARRKKGVVNGKNHKFFGGKIFFFRKNKQKLIQ